jgi:hypothetical protein
MVMTMAECIERDVVMKRIMAAKWMDGYDGAMAMEIAASAPAADVAPVVHGRWIEDGSLIITCSECKRGYNLIAKYTHYCPNCGAKMDGGADHEAD